MQTKSDLVQLIISEAFHSPYKRKTKINGRKKAARCG